MRLALGLGLCAWYGSAPAALAGGTYSPLASGGVSGAPYYSGAVAFCPDGFDITVSNLEPGKSYKVTIQATAIGSPGANGTTFASSLPLSALGAYSGATTQTWTLRPSNGAAGYFAAGTYVRLCFGVNLGNPPVPQSFGTTVTWNAYLTEASTGVLRNTATASATYDGSISSGSGSSAVMYSYTPRIKFQLWALNDGTNGTASDVQEPDSDGDGTPDSADPDDDNDGIPDVDDAAPNDPNAGGTDTDGDGTHDATDTDDDNDGTPDVDDPAPLDPSNDGSDPDTDGDGDSDLIDPDDDNDGTPDVDDPAPLDPSVGGSNGSGDGDGGQSSATNNISGGTVNQTYNNTTNNSTTNNTTNNYNSETDVSGPANVGSPQLTPGELPEGAEDVGEVPADAGATVDSIKGGIGQLGDKVRNWSPFGTLTQGGQDFTGADIPLPGGVVAHVNFPVDHPAIPAFRLASLFAVLVLQVRWVTYILKV